MSGEREPATIVQYSAHDESEPSPPAVSRHAQMRPERSHPASRWMEAWSPSSSESPGYAETIEHVAERSRTPAQPAFKFARRRRQPSSVDDQSARKDAPARSVPVVEPSAPLCNYWPELLDAPSDAADELIAALRARERLDRLDREQRGR